MLLSSKKTGQSNHSICVQALTPTSSWALLCWQKLCTKCREQDTPTVQKSSTSLVLPCHPQTFSSFAAARQAGYKQVLASMTRGHLLRTAQAPVWSIHRTLTTFPRVFTSGVFTKTSKRQNSFISWQLKTSPVMSSWHSTRIAQSGQNMSGYCQLSKTMRRMSTFCNPTIEQSVPQWLSISSSCLSVDHDNLHITTVGSQ